MNFSFQEKGKVKITMYEHIKKVLKEFPDPLRNKSLSSPNTPKLFEVRKDAIPLDEERSKLFHRLVAQLLYIMKRTRPDIAPAVPFLTTRVTKPTKDDWNKLRNVIEYLSQCWNLPLTLEADPNKSPTWSVDAAYSVHDDCKEHTGGSFTLGKGSLHTVSRKQKINSKSSTEA